MANHRPAGGIAGKNVAEKNVRTGAGAKGINVRWPATVGLSRGNKVMRRAEPLTGVRADPYKGPAMNPVRYGNEVAASTQCGVGGSRTIYKTGTQYQHGSAVKGEPPIANTRGWPDSKR